MLKIVQNRPAIRMQPKIVKLHWCRSMWKAILQKVHPAISIRSSVFAALIVQGNGWSIHPSIVRTIV